MKSLSQLLTGLGTAVVLFGLVLGSLLLTFVEQGKTSRTIQVSSTEPGVFLPQVDTATAQAPTITKAPIASQTPAPPQSPSQTSKASPNPTKSTTLPSLSATTQPQTLSATVSSEQISSDQPAETGLPATQTSVPTMTLIPVTVISNPNSISPGWESVTATSQVLP